MSINWEARIKLHEDLIDVLEQHFGHDEWAIGVTKDDGKYMIEIEDVSDD